MNKFNLPSKRGINARSFEFALGIIDIFPFSRDIWVLHVTKLYVVFCPFLCLFCQNRVPFEVCGVFMETTQGIVGRQAGICNGKYQFNSIYSVQKNKGCVFLKQGHVTKLCCTKPISFPRVSVVVVVVSSLRNRYNGAAQCSRRGPICPGYEAATEHHRHSAMILKNF